MSEITSLLKKLRPEVKARLKVNEQKYSLSVRKIMLKLDSTYFVGDLTIEDMRSIHVFSNTDYADQTAFQIMWGEKIFTDNGKFD